MQGVLLSAVILLLGLSMVLVITCRRLQARFDAYRDWAEAEIGRVSQTDPLTGALSAEFFRQQLDSECRRAVRDFNPLTLIKIDIAFSGTEVEGEALMREAGRILREQVSRPGDQVGRIGHAQFALLLPSTNERADALAERCHLQLLSQLEIADLQVTLAAQTFQPSSLLSATVVSQSLESLLKLALQEAPGRVTFRGEESDDLTLMTPF